MAPEAHVPGAVSLLFRETGRNERRAHRVVHTDLIGAKVRIARRRGHARSGPVTEMTGLQIDGSAVARTARHDQL
ncbi:MAG: hypothetical protein KDE45_19600, partial [Caldilineaceae bacterium]|nr:hypothetical protein [Caldilineaceae bacterium]